MGALADLCKQIATRPQRYPELRRLPKSHRFKSIQPRYQTPGSLDPFFHFDSTIYERDKLIDPSHPAAGVAPRFPFIREESIGVKLRPVGLLLREQRPFPVIPILTWTERVKWAKSLGIVGDPGSKWPKIPANLPFTRNTQLYPEQDYNSLVIPAKRVTPRGPLFDIALRKAAHRVPISLHIATSKKRMGQDRHMRRRIEKRLRAAVNLIVTRGATVGVDLETQSKTPIVFSEVDAGKHWVMQGWAYMFYPTSEVYNMPYATLIMKLRSLFARINKMAIQLEHLWLNQSLLLDQKSNKLPAPASSHTEKVELFGPVSNISDRLARPKKAGRWPIDDPVTENRVLDPPAAVLRSKGSSPAPASSPNPPKASKSRSPKILAGKDHDVWKKELLAGMSLIQQRVREEPKAVPRKPDTAAPQQAESSDTAS